MYAKLFNQTIEVELDEIGIIGMSFTNDQDIKFDESNDIQKQLTEYENGIRKSFDLPLHLKGTEFQKKVWTNLLTIPYGETASYKKIAILSGNEKASRAVGMANNRNPIPIIIPCHRVVGSTGKMVGYGGGLEIKEYLLKLEENNKNWL